VPDKLPTSKLRTHDKFHSNNLNIMKLITHGKGRRCLSGMIVDKAVSHASAAFVVRLQNSFVHKALDFAEGGVVACVEECGGFFCGEGLGETACHDFIDELLFTGAERVVCVGAAELDAADFRGEKCSLSLMAFRSICRNHKIHSVRSPLAACVRARILKYSLL
jgi:hypothetical protein